MRTLTDDEVARHLDSIGDQGYTVVEDAIEPDLVDELVDTLDRLEHDLAAVPADNSFEGRRTVRVYNLLVHGDVFARVPVHANVLPVVEGVLDPGCLLSSLSSIAIGPDESPQPIHADDQIIPLPKPHPPVVCNTMWALTDFTEANGATRLVPGTHLRESPEFGRAYESIPAVMEKGSVLVWHGSLWHGGGANTTAERRVGIACNYCAGTSASRRTSNSASRRRSHGRSTHGWPACAATASTAASSATSTSTTPSSCWARAPPRAWSGT